MKDGKEMYKVVDASKKEEPNVVKMRLFDIAQDKLCIEQVTKVI
jgi:hypothetical protein